MYHVCSFKGHLYVCKLFAGRNKTCFISIFCVSVTQLSFLGAPQNKGFYCDALYQAFHCEKERKIPIRLEKPEVKKKDSISPCQKTEFYLILRKVAASNFSIK